MVISTLGILLPSISENLGLSPSQQGLLGATPCSNMNSVPSARVTVVKIFGPKRDVHQLRGMASTMLPQKAAEPNRPC